MPAGEIVYLTDQSGNNVKWQSGSLPIAGFDYVSGVNRVISVDQSGQMNVALTVVDQITVGGISSGETHIMSGLVTLGSGGNTIGNVKISGESVVITSGTVTLTGYNSVLGQSVAQSGGTPNPRITANSGGQAFFSGNCSQLMVQYNPAAPVAGVVYISSSGQATSGLGIAIMSGAYPIVFPVTQAQNLYAVASVSGVLLSVMAVN